MNKHAWSRASADQAACASKQWSMIGCGTTTYTDPDAYGVNVPGATIELVVTGAGPFRARLTWVNLRRLRLALVDEARPRAAFLSLTPVSVFVSFPLSNDPPVVWNGVPMRRGELVLHGRRDHIHQRSTGSSRWGLIALARDDLAAYGQALLGTPLALPQTARFLRPPRSAMADILRLHTQACRLARTRPDMLTHPEVAHAFEQGLIHALVNGLAGKETCDGAATRQRHAEIMARFEDVLASQGDRRLSMSELTAAVGVPERTLRLCCAEFLGMSPTAYLRLRRLNLVRSALLRSNSRTETIATVARQHGFSELGRFAAAYRAVFGEAPSATLQAAIQTGAAPTCRR